MLIASCRGRGMSLFDEYYRMAKRLGEAKVPACMDACNPWGEHW
jgi:hypothetical protein